MRLLWALPLLCAATWAQAQEVRGFMQLSFARRVGEPAGKDFVSFEERLQLETFGSFDMSAWTYFAKVDFFHDAAGGDVGTEVREAYADFFGPNAQVRIGRQIITWGVGDLLFVNDLFPKDWEAFFSGRPLEYLKRGSDAVKIDVYGEKVSVEGVIMPFFRSDRLPRADRFLIPDPFAGVERRTVEPTTTLDNTEAALRLYGRLSDFDASLYAYRGFFRAPSLRPDDPAAPTMITAFFPRLNVYGFSLQGPAWQGVLSLEGGQYDSRDDPSGSDPVIPNSQTRFLVGYSRALDENRTAGVQYYGEYTHNYGAYRATLPPGFPVAPRFRQLVTFRFTQLQQYQTEQLSLFLFISPSDGDYMLIPEYRVLLNDQAWMSVGLNLFGGESGTQFGALGSNDNIYFNLRRSFD